MGSVRDWDEERSVISDKGDIGFIDFVNDKSVCNFNPSTEGPISISVPFPLVGGKPRSGYVGEKIVDSITILNTTTAPVDLWNIKIYDSKPEDSFTLSLMEPPTASSDVEYIQQFMESFSLEDRVLRPGRTLTVWLSCKPKEIGLHTTAVHFTMEDETIERLAFVLSEDKLSESLASTKIFRREGKKKQWSNLVGNNNFVAGSRPPRASTQVFRYKLPEYPIPEDARELIRKKQIPEAIEEGLTKENYASYFKHLVIMEEIKMEEDMRGYDMDSVNMKSRGNQFLTLEVPGLAERRPSLVYGDSIFAKLASEDNDTSPPYEGFIHRVEAEVIFLKFDKGFHSSYRASNLYNVQFTYNRINMRRLYHAIEAAKSLEAEFLFPADSYESRLIQTIPLVPVSSLLNEEQILSVEMILGCNGGAPYVIYGPPGTGKTMTIIEAILQLYTTRKNARILVCAPSNSAADHILEKLVEKAAKVKNREILRLNALSRPLEDVKPDYMKFCFYDEAEGVFKCPSLMDLRCYKIIISTYASSALLNAQGVRRGHFSHIFLDEAGQASEPETMVPLSNLCSRSTVVILAGDPMQLGPVIYSKDAEIYGLGKSYLERLFECDFYGENNQNYVIKLVRNYRCHPEILYLPSELFYQGELIPCKDDDDTRVSRAWADLLPNKDFPVLFFGIQGLDEREGSNPSWFNRIEASKTVEIIRYLTETGVLGDEEIGVITPYRQQVLKIKKALEGFGRANIQVGSVEQFQGQERQVIIVSTVRSTIKHNEFDRTHCLGFLSNPRRFNVAITRAKSLLVVIGNPHIVSKDPYWNKLLWHCSDNSSYKGCFLPDREELLDKNLAQVDNLDNEQEYRLQRWKDGEWGQPSEDGEWGQPSEDGEWSQPSKEVEWGSTSKEVEWGQQTFQPDESTEWSDG